MQISFNPNISNNQVNFKALKEVHMNDLKLPWETKENPDPFGTGVGHGIISKLKENDAFNELCDKFDVHVYIQTCLDTVRDKNDTIFMFLDIYVQKSKNIVTKSLRKLFGIYDKTFVARSWASQLGGFNTTVAEIIKNNISAEDGIGENIRKFLNTHK